MRRIVQFGFLTSLVAAAAGLCAYYSAAADQPPPVLPPPNPEIDKRDQPENHGFDPAIEKTAMWMGVATCASSACHHENGHDGAPRSEYTTFKGVDPHAKAFGVLFNDRSDRIMHNLYNVPANIKGAAATKELCLKCHSSYTDNQKVGERFSHNDGVGCESCHGPAEKWLTSHYQAGFKSLSLEEKAAYGLRPTKDLLHRTRLCTSCHVGDANKDVNHDLIAAGHPRLAFEMAGFQAIYPRHWQYADDKARYPDFEARTWALGQVVTAKASLDLLEARAEGAHQNKRPWPEFAEYDCFKCHQKLQVNSENQKYRWENKVKLGEGSLSWGTWTYGLFDIYPDFIRAPHAGENPALKELRDMMKGRQDEEKVAAKAHDIAGNLNGLLLQLRDSKPMSPDLVRSLLIELADKGIEKGQGLEWDEATQLYLGIAALHRGLENGGASQPIKALGVPLQKSFLPARALPETERVDSPTSYDKERKLLKQRFEDIRSQFGK
jgi:hypothetical protein